MASTARFRSGLVWCVVLALLGVVAGTGTAGAVENPPVFITKWGTFGTGNGQFKGPVGVAVNGDGNVYVVDVVNNRVQKFTSTGAFITKWGTTGTGNGQFREPEAVAVDGNDDVYVAETGSPRIQKFTSTGAFVTKWGTTGSGNGQFEVPSGVAVDADGNVYVSDAVNNRVQKFTSTGTFITKWGTAGSANGQFQAPQGVAVDGDGNVYVVDALNNRVQKFTSTGTFITKWGIAGFGDGQFEVPSGVAVDDDGDVYVTDLGFSDRVQKFTSAGAFLTTWGRFGSGDGQFDIPRSVAVDDDGNVYVVDALNNRVQKFGLVPRPDGRIRRGVAGTYAGNNIYNTTGVNQTRTGSASPGGSVRYWVSAQNDAPIPDALRLRGTATNTGFAVKYIVDGIDVTAQVTAGTYTTPVLAPGATHVVKAVVTVTSTASPGSILSASLVTRSNADPTRRDTVKFVTSRT